MGLFTKVFGTYSQRELKSIYPIVDKITALEDEYKQLTDAELQAKTPEFKERLANGETLDDILPEAFAAVREAAGRVLGMRPYPVRRNEDRRGQNAGGHPACLSERADR